jgi:uncharacterized protein DUF6918
MTVNDAVRDGERRTRIVDDCVELVDAEVGKKSGLGGMVVKAGYKAVKGIKPGFIRKVVDKLLDEWAVELDPIWSEAQAKGKAPRAHLEAQPDRVAEALLKVTDEKAKGASGMVRSTYDKLRGSAKKHVEEAVPGLAALLEKHVA